MAPLQFNNTALVIYTYSWSNGTGQFIVRYDDALNGPLDVNSEVSVAMGLLNARLDNDWKFTSARNQEKNASVSIPIALPTNPTPSGGSQPAADRPLEVNFVGRTAGGRRAEVSIFGCVIDVPEKYRYQNGDVAEFDAFITDLNASAGVGVFLAVDGLEPIWYPYTNLNYNSYWERRARR